MEGREGKEETEEEEEEVAAKSLAGLGKEPGDEVIIE